MSMHKIQYGGSHKVILRLCETVNALIDAVNTPMAIDTEPTEDSMNPITSGAVYSVTHSLQDQLKALEDRVKALETKNTSN